MKNVIEQSVITIVKFLAKIFKLPYRCRLVPTIDSTVAHGGCTFTTVSGSGDSAISSWGEAYLPWVDFMHRRVVNIWFISKFYHTHAPLEVIKDRYEQTSMSLVLLEYMEAPSRAVARWWRLSGRTHEHACDRRQLASDLWEETSELANTGHTAMKLSAGTVKRVRERAAGPSHLIMELPGKPTRWWMFAVVWRTMAFEIKLLLPPDDQYAYAKETTTRAS